MKDIIIYIISMRNGIKSVPLVLAVMEAVNPQRFSKEQYDKDINELVHEGIIRELEYTDPDTPYRIKSMYFFKGTMFWNLRGFIDARASENTLVRKS